jgi:hypothetical protein
MVNRFDGTGGYKPDRVLGDDHSTTSGIEEFEMTDRSDLVGQCRPAYRKWLLGLILLHLLAVVAEPLVFFSRSDFQVAPEFLGLRGWLSPYVDWMYLDHGYFFFAPNPGPSHLVAIQAKQIQPSVPRRLRADAWTFPDRMQQWPRLLYHRYFMLSEFYNNSFAPTELIEQDKSDADFVQRWKSDRSFYETLQRSILKSASASGGVSGDPGALEILRVERPLPSPEQILSGTSRLGDSRELAVLPEGPELVEEPSSAGAP